MTETLRPGDDPQKQGVKFDHGKLRWSLLPWESVQAVLEVLEFGARKYAARNWESGMDYSRCFDATLRHLTKWWQREDNDKDSGLSHLWHAATNIFFLIAYQKRGKGTDDRPVNN